MTQDYSNKNLQNASLRDEDFRNTVFSGSDLRGADLSGSDFTNADLSNTKTGVTPVGKFILFIVALAVSLLSGYFAAELGLTLKAMLHSQDPNVRTSGIVTIVAIGASLLYACWKGGDKSFKYVIIPAIIAGIIFFVVYKVSGLGTGRGMLFLIGTLLLLIVMVYIGTISRVAAGSLSHVFFMIVALSGGVFGKSIAGGIVPVILAIACMIISQRALSGAKGFGRLRRIANAITERFGTSFRNAKLRNTDFSGSSLHNADFTGADLASVKWDKAVKTHCKVEDKIISDKKPKHG